jgi:hypothetical protein
VKADAVVAQTNRDTLRDLTDSVKPEEIFSHVDRKQLTTVSRHPFPDFWDCSKTDPKVFPNQLLTFRGGSELPEALTGVAAENPKPLIERATLNSFRVFEKALTAPLVVWPSDIPPNRAAFIFDHDSPVKTWAASLDNTRTLQRRFPTVKLPATNLSTTGDLGADKKAKDEDEQMPLHFAANRGSEVIVWLPVETLGADKVTNDNNG